MEYLKSKNEIDFNAYNPKVMNTLMKLIQEKIRNKCTNIDIYDNFGGDDIHNDEENILEIKDISFVVVDLGIYVCMCICICMLYICTYAFTYVYT